MAHNDDSEKDIWEYKSLEKKRKRNDSSFVTKRRCASRKKSKNDTSIESSNKSENNKAADYVVQNGFVEAHEFPPKLSSPKETVQSENHAAEGPACEDHCPICQMPFFILVVQSQRWHIAECLDTSRDKCKECPDGLQCSSTIPNHYKKFNHTLLAHSRANSNTATLSLPQQAEKTREPILSCLPRLTNYDSCILESSHDRSFSASSSPTVSLHQHHSGTPPSKLTNGLLLLRSPGPEDFKKKKGWLSSSKGQKSVSSSQESKTESLGTNQAHEDLSKDDSFLETDEAISYSPLSELPAETEVGNGCRKALFDNDASENEGSMILFNDSFSSEDELLAEFADNHLEVSNMPENDPASSNSQLSSVSSLAPTNEEAVSAVKENGADCSDGKGAFWKSASKTSSSLQSPQSVVLEHLRETLLSSEGQCVRNLNNSNIQQHQPHTTPEVFSSQKPAVPRSQNMPPQKSLNKAGQASGLKQTDIGVFFGLKPLKQKEPESGPKELSTSSIPTAGENSGQKRQRRNRQRKSKADTAGNESQDTETVNELSSVGGQGEAGRGRTRGWRRRWNRGNADGEVELPRCPFYKKIPGTRFAVDAFRYGEVEGITAYFLTHFHSDHYGGLTKNSTFPIYCNRITGNLVKSKLKVAEQYVHILPMNTEVTVEGVRVILLDANHCPGAAMLLFFLPHGQTVLHTGDFRADPSMETYPELLRCRVQTLYLDTTYCSPEYTFPRQQEVISFAASTAFETVTLNPRTLVVCGSYSVGKEKVFLALAEVLGSKVCLSRDKYNTMCCLESEEVRERITTDWKAAQVHVLPMMQLSFKKLQDYLARFSQQYDQLLAFKPTGWTFSQQVESVEDIQPEISGNISIYGIPYSEHSSFLELKRFVQWLKPLKIIPTVNVGSWVSRKAMEKCFSEWLLETKTRL
ncbi:DNA cross-link repair 1A protein [Melanotaenia boesemani]|uniref:DNA cross-link repair 1A protein n=1 Tax=Melanotaenia boesemani TaxID=1250792 RepID=UPI001C043C30|nr:DNA cross-link repair 1A protein [Melanotaenia boesemani]